MRLSSELGRPLAEVQHPLWHVKTVRASIRIPYVARQILLGYFH